MRPVLQTCTPRDEVLKGDLEDALFAADFGFVIEGRARSVYQDPATSFRNTHPASELAKVMQAVFGRLNNPSEPGAVLRLCTGFGGGKTHTLIAMWHLAAVAWLVNAEWLPSRIVPSPRLVGAWSPARGGDLRFEPSPGRHPIRELWFAHRNPIFRDLFVKLQGIGAA